MQSAPGPARAPIGFGKLGQQETSRFRIEKLSSFPGRPTTSLACLANRRIGNRYVFWSRSRTAASESRPEEPISGGSPI